MFPGTVRCNIYYPNDKDSDLNLLAQQQVQGFVIMEHLALTSTDNAACMGLNCCPGNGHLDQGFWRAQQPLKLYLQANKMGARYCVPQ